ncbi:MAG: glycoside hydrolase family 3 C-terminal domain-containing protein [Oscillospiraceae bacterium]|nr:glycoside hydrolase family 3 C-terminal domain-containing protein [Oscillospiraceae bacterium]
MDERKAELKQLKKACKKAKRKHVTLWKSLGIFLLVFAIIFSVLAPVAQIFDNAVAAFMGGRFWTVENEDPNANYFELDYKTDDERLTAGKDVCYQVEAEGAALLMNNGALPLKEGAKVSTLSTSSVNIVYGGTGSGNVDASKADSLKVALEKSGLVVNPTLWEFYTTGAGAAYSRDAGAGETAALMGSFNIGEAPWSVYTDDVKNSIAEYGDAVIVTLSRIGGEGADAKGAKPGEENYLALDQNEKDMMAAAAQLKKDGKIKSIVVLINTSNPLQVDFLKENEYGVDAVLWIGGVGAYGTNAVTDILAGKVNPSGSLVDTYCYDNFSAPAMKNAVPVVYGGYDGKNIPDYAETYLIYQEGIYVGYKYYETRYEDFVMGTEKTGTYAYGDDVAFPFGYGLSYTKFDYSAMAVVYNAETDQFEVSVTVTNSGDVKGKETVQIYAQSPYTAYDKENKVEKAAVQLVGFGKTAVLEPGASETVTVLVDKRDLASYDAYGAKTYILDAGDYYLTVATDAHNAVNNILAAKGFTPETTENRMDAAGKADLTYQYVQDAFDAETYATSANGTKIENQLSLADPNLYEGTKDQNVTWLSRSDWEGTYPSDEQIVLQLTELLIKDLQQMRYDPANYEAAEMPTLGADNGLKLVEMIGLDYDDPKWESLLDQLTYDEMVSLIGDSFHWRMPAESVQAPGSRDENGPQGLTVTLFGSTLGVDTTAFTSEDVMAATFNTELMYQVGKVIGNDCLAADVSCLYGPGANMHRMPYGGRNFEYYSEDGFLSGEICAAEVKGIQEKGVDVVIKHFALNDSEQDRIGLGVWLNEQAAREIYLKAYQAAFEEAGANGVMTAYTRWGAVWSGGVKGLMTNIMRKEWGNNGMSITDNVITPMVTGADGVLAGVTTYDAMLPNINNELPGYENDAVIVNAMREACHHNLYALANSSAMNGIGPDTVIKAQTLPIVSTAWTIMIILWVLHVAAVVMWVLGKNKWKKTEAYLNYKTMKNAIKTGVAAPAAAAPAEEIPEEETSAEAPAEEPKEE